MLNHLIDKKKRYNLVPFPPLSLSMWDLLLFLSIKILSVKTPSSYRTFPMTYDRCMCLNTIHAPRLIQLFALKVRYSFFRSARISITIISSWRDLEKTGFCSITMQQMSKCSVLHPCVCMFSGPEKASTNSSECVLKCMNLSCRSILYFHVVTENNCW